MIHAQFCRKRRCVESYDVESTLYLGYARTNYKLAPLKRHETKTKKPSIVKRKHYNWQIPKHVRLIVLLLVCA